MCSGSRRSVTFPGRSVGSTRSRHGVRPPAPAQPDSPTGRDRPPRAASRLAPRSSGRPRRRNAVVADSGFGRCLTPQCRQPSPLLPRHRNASRRAASSCSSASSTRAADNANARIVALKLSRRRCAVIRSTASFSSLSRIATTRRKRSLRLSRSLREAAPPQEKRLLPSGLERLRVWTHAATPEGRKPANGAVEPAGSVWRPVLVASTARARETPCARLSPTMRRPTRRPCTPSLGRPNVASMRGERRDDLREAVPLDR
jgi:hypothetical protein